MEGMSVKNLASSACVSVAGRWNLSKVTPAISAQMRRVNLQVGCSRLICSSKKSDFQDFQEYAKPARLLPCAEADTSVISMLGEISDQVRLDESRSTYMVRLNTSNISGSYLSDENAGVLVCLIDRNGDSVLQRISSSSVKDEADLDLLCFQRGSIDEFLFDGPKLENIEAVWIGLESGRWRLGGLGLTVVGRSETQSHPTNEDGNIVQNSALQYEFEAEDIHLGEGTDMSMVELRPSRVTELSGDLSALVQSGLSQATSALDRQIANEESMKEYASLKFSLLLYDAMLILGGTSVMSITTGEKAVNAFLAGGAGGFFYLLLLQRSVDGLPAPTAISSNKDDSLLGQLRRPISSFALAFGFALVAAKYASGTTSLVLTPQEIIIGMTGFLVCKFAIVLAALKPIPMRLK